MKQLLTAFFAVVLCGSVAIVANLAATVTTTSAQKVETHEQDHEHDHGHDHDHGHSHGEGEDHAHDHEEGITFTREQQKAVEFALTKVAERVLHEAIPVYGAVEAAPEATVSLAAPAAGRILAPEQGFPRLGQRVEAGQVLALLQPRLTAEADIATLQRDLRLAESALDTARREVERLAPLAEAGAVPQRQLTEAQAALRTAEIERDSAARRLSQDSAFRKGGSQQAMPLTAPQGGVVRALSTRPGEFVADGQEVLSLLDPTRLLVRADIPEHQLARLQAPAGCWVETGPTGAVLEIAAEHLLSAPLSVHPESRTAEVRFAAPPQSGLVLGQQVRVGVRSGLTRTALAVPRSAVFNDDGFPVVFIALDRERFDRHPVRLGLRDGDWVEVLSGVRVGDRVVSKGAFAVKLASSAAAVPDHGHAH